MPDINIFQKDLRNTITKEVPFIPGAQVVFFDDITTGQIRQAQSLGTDASDMNTSISIMLSQIADWNFADDKGKLSITPESIDRLPMKLVTWITETEAEILNTLNDKKKESPES